MDARNLFLCLTALFASLAAGAQDMPDSTRYSFGRQPVKSSHTSGSPYADTLDTENPAVKVLLFNNGTYRYVKDPKIVADNKVFTEHWDTRSVNPYHDETPLPDRFTLWIVDTLDSYCCPNQTTPSSKFGYRHGRRHQGIDLPYPKGTPVYAAFDGKVRIS
ncbi:MAG: M23 family metallopeptidase, partial [Bacteroidales bacterium]|nr:M23 family metallopeptidase [Bacteroidales bacterium]